MLSACRTAFNRAARRRMLPPFAENPFRQFPIDKLKDPGDAVTAAKVFSAEQEDKFFPACDGWQRPLFLTLATYGLRVGELTHLLIEDIDLAAGCFTVRSKPWLLWHVKTGRERPLPLLPSTREVFERAIAGRKAGFAFVNAGAAGRAGSPPAYFSRATSSPQSGPFRGSPFNPPNPSRPPEPTLIASVAGHVPSPPRHGRERPLP